MEAFSTKMTNSEPPFLAIETPAVANGEGNQVPEGGEKKRERTRKGIPHRAPMF